MARDPFTHYGHTEIGYNYRMRNIVAAIGRGELGVLDERVARRREIFWNNFPAFSCHRKVKSLMRFAPVEENCYGHRRHLCLAGMNLLDILLIRRNKPLACQWYEQWLCQ